MGGGQEVSEDDARRQERSRDNNREDNGRGEGGHTGGIQAFQGFLVHFGDKHPEDLFMI